MNPWPARDLREHLDLALERGGHLLTAGELAVARRLLALDDGAFAGFATLAARVDRPHPQASVDAAHLAAWLDADLVDAAVSARVLARAHTVAELRAACVARGWSTRGDKAALVERVAPHRRWWAEPWFQLRHRGLLRRVRQWAELHPAPDPSARVVERLGLVRWPTYATTSGAATFPDRAALRRWEAALAAAEPEDAAAAWARGDGAGPGGLDLTWLLAERVRSGAEVAERAGDLPRADALHRAFLGRKAAVAFRASRVREALGDPLGALQWLRDGLADATPAEARSLVRAGRRLSKSVGRSFPPAPPAAGWLLRTVRLRPAPADGPRPRWEDGDFVEDAVVGWLAGFGRRAIHSEGSAWRTVVSVFLADIAFLPIPGALPVPRLSAPLDFGAAAFAARRASPLRELDAHLLADPATVWADAAPRWLGVRARGVDPAWSADQLEALVRAVPGHVWAGLVRDRAAGRSFSGLPDLLVFPGDGVTLPGALPSKLGPGLVAVELKGPGDHLRDGQLDWLDTLCQLGVRAEVWEVEPTRR